MERSCKHLIKFITPILGVIPALAYPQERTDSLREKAMNNQNTELWDIELYQYDKDRLLNDDLKPMNWIAYPIEGYELGVFSDPFDFKIDDTFFSGIAFGENLPSKEGSFNFDYYATLIFCTNDSTKQIEANVISRNAPSITIQGQLKLNERYDFIGVKNPDDTGTLFVGVKSFDFRFGSTIIIFPNTGNSFTYLQLNDLPASNDDFENYLERIRNNKRVLRMLKYNKTVNQESKTLVGIKN